MENTTNAIANAALTYARKGYAVLALQPGTKLPYTTHGVDDATSDIEQVREWWACHPDSNIGVRPPPGVLVLDVESMAGHGIDGFATMAALVAKLGPLPDNTPKVITPTGGVHYWLRYNGEAVWGSLGPGVDVKTHSGYVVVPPSVINGERYRWLR